MVDFDFIAPLVKVGDTKIVLLVIDGLGGLPKRGDTELAKARTPNMDSLLKSAELGLMHPIKPGITPGSGPGHLAVFGYDSRKFIVGRGVLEALGIGFSLKKGDLATRANFATIDKDGNIADRRAGRIPTKQCEKLCEKVREIRIPGTEVFIQPIRDYRAAVIFRGRGLSDRLSESDPQKTGVPPLKVEPLSEKAKKSAKIVNDFIAKAREILKDSYPANMILLRGFGFYSELPAMGDVYKIKPVAIAGYPMYRGVARLVGMDVAENFTGIEEQFESLKELFNSSKYDFFFVHVKYTDSHGEDGDFERKVRVIEEVDRHIPKITALNPDVLAITADHSTPALYKAHSWHPVPLMVVSKWARVKKHAKFSENECASGNIGAIEAVDLMSLLLAHAGRLKKFGA